MSPPLETMSSRVVLYKLRAECSSDSLVVRTLLQAWVVDWQESQTILVDSSGMEHRVIDMDVSFSLYPTAPGLEELRWLIRKIEDCHVAADTLDLAEHYTGARVFSARDGCPPSRTMLKVMGINLEMFRSRIDRLSPG